MADGRTSTSTRQVISRSLLDKIANKNEYVGTQDNKPADSTELKNILSGINSELNLSYFLSESTTPDLVLNISTDTFQNSETSLNRTHTQTNNSFSGGTVEFPAADAGVIVVTPGLDSTLSLSSGNFKKVLVQIDESGQLSIKQGAEAASAALAEAPEADGRNVGIGYVVLENNAGVIQNITNDIIFQYVDQSSNLSLTVQEADGSPLIKKVTTIKFPNDTVTDDGNGVVSVDLSSSANLVDDEGNSTIKLKPSLTNFTLQSPDSTIWGFTASNDGIVQSESGSLNPVTNVKILRDDGEEVSFRVTNDGLLQAVSPADAGATLVNNIFLDSPEGTAWELRVTTLAANFVLESPNGTLYEIAITDDGTLTSTEVSEGVPQNIKLRRQDLTEVGIQISDDGELVTENPPQVGAVLKNKIFLKSPDDTIFELKINNDDAIFTDIAVGVDNKNIVYTSTTLTCKNRLQVQNDKEEPLFSVREFEEIDLSDNLQKGAFVEMPILTINELESIQNPDLSSNKVTAEVYLDTGSGIRKVFYDTFDNEWKYMHDLSVVFP